jgi:hypothetical protein
MGSLSSNKISLLKSIEPFLTVRHYYVLAVRNKLFTSTSASIRSVIGHDHKRVLMSASKAMNRIVPGKSPMLRPPGVWASDLEYAAGITSSFGRKLINHGIRPSEVSLLNDNRLENYSSLRLMGLDQKEACSRNGSPKKLSLDDEVIHKLQVKKFGHFKQKNGVVKRWTRGAVRAYSRMRVGHGGCIVNKCDIPRKAMVKESEVSFGVGNAMETCRRMAILSQRIIRVFIKSLLDREILEFSELTPNEFEFVLSSIAVKDWRILVRGDGTFIRCYWRLKITDETKWVSTQRSEVDNGYLLSSIDLSANDL